MGVGGVELFGVAGLDHRGGGAGGVLFLKKKNDKIVILISKKH